MKSSLLWLTLATVVWVITVSPKQKAIVTVVEEPKTEEESVTDQRAKESVQVEQPKRQNIEINTKESDIEALIKIALGHLGKPYVYGTIGPESFDCSGFVYGVHRQLGIHLPRTSLNQSKIPSAKISREDLQRGDLVFFDTSGKGVVNHSGIYLGDAEFIHASSGKAYSVTISSLEAWYKDKFKWGKRINATK